ncbi:hypothetical protein AOLI_G00243600 [Acnodon oligacanthus]
MCPPGYHRRGVIIWLPLTSPGGNDISGPPPIRIMCWRPFAPPALRGSGVAAPAWSGEESMVVSRHRGSRPPSCGRSRKGFPNTPITPVPAYQRATEAECEVKGCESSALLLLQ